MRKPKILILGKLPPPYMGPAIATKILLNSSLNDEFKLLHVNTNVHSSLNTIGTLSLKKIRQNLGVYKRLLHLVRTERPELVLIPISQSTVGFVKDSIFILISRLMGRKVLLHLRGSDFKNWLHRSSKLVRNYAEKIVGITDGVIVLGENLRHLFTDYYSDDQIHVVPNGANYDFPGCEVKHISGYTRFLYLANLQASKGIVDVVRAAILLKNQGVEGFHLDVVGNWRDPDTENLCKQLVADNGLPVTFHGPAYGDEKLLFMLQADAFIFTPRAPEGHPWVIVEAMASGLPIIATDRGAIVESVIHEHNGFIVQVCSPLEIAEKMRQLMEEPALRKAFASASRQRYQKHFTEERMVKRLSDVFKQVLQIPQPQFATQNEHIFNATTRTIS